MPHQTTLSTADIDCSRPACPMCSGGVERVPRRGLDHLISALLPLRRYRCRGIHCKWEGTLRSPHNALEGSDYVRLYQRRLD